MSTKKYSHSFITQIIIELIKVKKDSDELKEYYKNLAEHTQNHNLKKKYQRIYEYFSSISKSINDMFYKKYYDKKYLTIHDQQELIEIIFGIIMKYLHGIKLLESFPKKISFDGKRSAMDIYGKIERTLLPEMDIEIDYD